MILLKVTLKSFVPRWSVFPIRPKEKSLRRIKSDGSRRRHFPGNESSPQTSVQSGNFDLVQIALDPVQISSDPIDRQTFRRGQSVLDDRTDVGQRSSDQSSSINLVVHDVGPEDEVFFFGVIEVDRDRVLQAGHERPDRSAVHVDGSQLVSGAEDDQWGWGVVFALAGKVVRLQKVTFVAKAFVAFAGNDFATLWTRAPSVARVIFSALGEAAWVLK